MALDSSNSSETPSKLRTVRLPLWVTLVALVLLVAAIGWHLIAQRQADERQARAVNEITQKLNAEHAAARSKDREIFLRESEEVHRLFGNALAWTVRGAVLRNNYDEIGLYFDELIKNPHIRVVLLTDTNGKVLLSTDRNLKDSAFSQHYPAALLNERTVAIHPGEGRLKRLVMPIQGLSGPLGTALVVYEAPALPNT